MGLRVEIHCDSRGCQNTSLLFVEPADDDSPLTFDFNRRSREESGWLIASDWTRTVCPYHTGADKRPDLGKWERMEEWFSGVS